MQGGAGIEASGKSNADVSAGGNAFKYGRHLPMIANAGGEVVIGFVELQAGSPNPERYCRIDVATQNLNR
jgi:hypothetical protein